MLKYNLHHVNGLFFELLDDESKGREYDVTVIDKATAVEVYSVKLKVNHWLKLNRKYLSDLVIVIKYQEQVVQEISLLEELEGQTVLISFESSSLGDSLAWIPYCLQFQEVYKCTVIVSTFKNELFESVYPELTFIGRGVTVDNLKAMFQVGWFWVEDEEPVNPITIPLQQSACNILNLEYKEIIPRIAFTPSNRPIEDKYVCISTTSTSQCKLWYYWQDLIDGLRLKGYKVVDVSLEGSNYTGLELVGSRDTYSLMNLIHHSEFLVGLGSGSSWLAWALRKHVVMISNFSEEGHEFATNCTRITNTSVCHGCWNNTSFRFDKGDWYWCPVHKDTDRQFECHKLISSEQVLKAINEALILPRK